MFYLTNELASTSGYIKLFSAIGHELKRDKQLGNFELHENSVKDKIPENLLNMYYLGTLCQKKIEDVYTEDTFGPVVLSMNKNTSSGYGVMIHSTIQEKLR